MKGLLVSSPRTFELVEKEIPKLQDNQVLVKIKYAGVCGSDGHIWHKGMSKYVIGHEICGFIEDPGNSEFKKGDKVCLSELSSCFQCEFCKSGRDHLCNAVSSDGPGLSRDGGYAEFVPVRADMVRKVPDDLPLELAALTEPVAVALHGINRLQIPPGETLLVWGNGPIGAYAAFCAKQLGVKKVYMVGRGQRRVDLCNEFDFVDECFSVKDPDFEKKILNVSPEGGFGYVVDALGSNKDFNRIIGYMKKDGNLVLQGMQDTDVIFRTISLLVKEINVYPGILFTIKEFEDALAMINKGKKELQKTITSIIPLDVDSVQNMFVKMFDSGENDDYKVLIDPELT